MNICIFLKQKKTSFFYRILFFLIFIPQLSFSQSSDLNSYKYAIVSSRFSFQKNNDEYRLNTLTKMFLQQYGFIAYLDSDPIPDELLNSNCSKVYVDVASVGSFITTKLKLTIKNCKKGVLFTSVEGKSKEKEYAKAYNEALREALQSLKTVNYKYNDVEKPAVFEELTPNNQVITNETFNNETISEVLFAQPIINGFQLIDKSPRVVIKIFKTSNPNCFIATKEAIQGVLILKESQWFFEYYENQKLISERVEVKF